MFPSYSPEYQLAAHHDRVDRLRADARRFRQAREARPAPAHRRTRWWSRTTDPSGGTVVGRAPVHP